MNIKQIATVAFLISLSSCQQELVPNELIPKFDSILANPSVITEYSFRESLSVSKIEIPFDFASNKLRDSLIPLNLENTHIKLISYVYSDYKSDDRFNQDEFNRERLYELYTYFPELFEGDEVKWEVFSQTGATNEASANELFHGFVIFYRPAPTDEMMQREIAFINSMIDSVDPYLAPTAPPSRDSFYYEESFGIFDEVEHKTITEILVKKSTVDIPKAETRTYRYGKYFKDTVVSAVLERNDHWQNMLITCDLTGSMSPYSSQLFVWHRLNFDKNKIQHFTFFNDGNRTPDRKKVVGQTGGIYHSKANDFDELMKVAFKTMNKGNGGDAPENDIEALLKGIDKCPNCEEIILIADNYANMRDFSLIENINKPIRVILCGTKLGINIQYLELARVTKGSVHTIEQDISNLMELREGEEITIGNQTFLIKNGRFVERRSE